jgi:hypothetical protein
LQVDAPVVIGEEDVAACVAALGDVVREAGGDDTCEAGYVDLVAAGVGNSHGKLRGAAAKRPIGRPGFGCRGIQAVVAA